MNFIKKGQEILAKKIISDARKDVNEDYDLMEAISLGGPDMYKTDSASKSVNKFIGRIQIRGCIDKIAAGILRFDLKQTADIMANSANDNEAIIEILARSGVKNK